MTSSGSQPQHRPNGRRWSLLAVVLLAISWTITTPVTAEQGLGQISEVHDLRPAVRLPRASQSLLLDVVGTGTGFVAVGERGHVLQSADGMTWTQAQFVPVQATLTKLTAVGDRLWAVGHDTTIIYSRDGGDTWALQYFDPELEMPLLDVHFFDRYRGLAIGAYGVYLVTDDGGAHWSRYNFADRVTSEAIDWAAAAESVSAFMAEALDEGWDDDFGTDDDWLDDEWLDDEDSVGFDKGCYEFMECHLNAFLDLGDGRFMIAAERGYGFRSVDGGENWESFRFSYPGSMFGIVAMDEAIIAFGLRGHVQRSDDFGDEWQVLDSPIESSLLAAAWNEQGQLMMVGANAARLSYDPATGRLSATEDRLGSAYAGVLLTDQGHLILVGAEGVKRE